MATAARAVQALSAMVVQRITHLTQGEMGAACGRWLAALASECLSAGHDILRACTSAPQLTQVEAPVRAALSAWKPPFAVETAQGVCV